MVPVSVVIVMAVALVIVSVAAVIFAYLTAARQIDYHEGHYTAFHRYQEATIRQIEDLLNRIQAPAEAAHVSLSQKLPVEEPTEEVIDTPAGPVVVGRQPAGRANRGQQE